MGTFHLPHSQTKNRKTAFSSLFANTHVDVALVPPIGDLCLVSFRQFLHVLVNVTLKSSCSRVCGELMKED